MSELRSMAASSSSPQPKDEYHAFSGIEPEGLRRKVSKSTALYDVFINHRGPDSKYSLALPLYTSLKELGIRAFLDKEEMELGHSFPSTIETAINSAVVHIAIFSKRYAESPWCLAELVLMLQSPAKIIPVFYEVEPWELRHIENGVYADAFIEYQKKSRYLDKLQQWKEALQSISFTTGYEMNNSNIGDHKSILLAVEREMQTMEPLIAARYPVALDKLVQDFERRCLYILVQDFEFHCGMNNEQQGKARIVGIFGMGGVGKTTLSKELFNRKRQQYDQACFLFDVREYSDKSRLPSLQMKFLKDLFGERDLCFQSTEEGLSRISNCIKRSSSLSFLIVLDDINHVKQLNNFSIMDILEKPGNSLVIITTRDVGILIAEGINVGYHLKGMGKEDARQLFSWHAFSQPHPASGYEELVDDFVGVCGGLPLSLQVLGSHVHGRDENYWRSELQKLGRTMHQDIRESLRISFDALSTEEKQIFIDVTCFFVDESKCIAISVWKATGWSAENGLQALKDKCLVEEIGDPITVLRMHDHLRDLGREMADEYSRPRRLWHPQDLKNLESKGFENIVAQTKGRCFHSFFDKSLNFEVKFFLRDSDDGTEMSSFLLLLHLWYPHLYSGPCSSELNHLSHAQQQNLRVESGIPSCIPVQDVQWLTISNGYFQRLWEHDAEALSKLKKLEIHRTFVEEYPDFLGIFTHVEEKVRNEVTESPQMSKMKSLIVKTFRRLSGSLPTTSARESSSFKVPLNGDQKSATIKAPLSLLEDLVIKEQENIERVVLNGSYCQNLRSLELSSLKNLMELRLARVETLNCLSVSKCESLKMLSVTSDLVELEELSISRCYKLKEPNFGHLKNLKKLRIANCIMDNVPGISSFEMLVELNIIRCYQLRELCLAHLNCLEKLEVKDCDHLESVMGIHYLLKLVEVSISWCWILQLDLHLVGLNSLKSITIDKFVKVKRFELIDCKNLETVSGISFEMIQVINICGCPELKDFPDIYSPSCLELIVNGCGKLNHLRLTSCRILKRVTGNFDLNGLFISDCPMLSELPSFEHLIYLEEIHILQCRSLQSITLPATLKCLELNSCRELKTMAGISGLTKLAELYISNCPELEQLTVLSDSRILKRITIDRCEKLNCLQVAECTISKGVSCSIDLGHMPQLSISDCPALEELSCNGCLTCLKQIHIFRCRRLHKIDFPISLNNLQLNSCRELNSVSETSCHKNLVDLILPDCRQLELEFCHKNLVDLIISDCGLFELDFRLEGMDSLQTITFEGCGKHKSLILNKCQNLKRLVGNFDAERLFIGSCPKLEELPYLAGSSCLEEIDIDSCDKLISITLPMTHVKLAVHRCRELQMIAAIGSFPKLRDICIRECEQLEMLPEFLGLSELIIDSCQKLHSVALPTTVEKATLQRCRNLWTVAGMGHLTKLTELHISECPVIEEMPVVCGLSCLEMMTIEGWGKFSYLRVTDCEILKVIRGNLGMGHLAQLWISDCPELEELPCFEDLTCLVEIRIFRCRRLQNITLPRKLKILQLESCRRLKSVSEIAHLKNLVELIISDCGQLELEVRLEWLDSLQRIIFDCCVEIILINSCEKLQSILLPTTVIKLRVHRCRELRMVKGIGNLTKLEKLSVSECPELEELPILAGLSCLEKIVIDSCEKLYNIILPTTLMKLSVRRYRDSQMLAAIENLTNLEELSICECPNYKELSLAKLNRLKMVAIITCEKIHRITLPTTLIELRIKECTKLPILGTLSSLKRIIIESCQRLENIQRIKGLQALEAIQFLFCSNSVIRDCIYKVKPIHFIRVVGRAADGAKSNLTTLFSPSYFRNPDMVLRGFPDRRIIIICGVVKVKVSSCSAPLYTANISVENSAWKLNLPHGEWIITTIYTGKRDGLLDRQFHELCMIRIMKPWCIWSVRAAEDWRIHQALTTIAEKLHDKSESHFGFCSGEE